MQIHGGGILFFVKIENRIKKFEKSKQKGFSG